MTDKAQKSHAYMQMKMEHGRTKHTNYNKVEWNIALLRVLTY